MKVLFAYETGEPPEFSWLQFDWSNRWIDKTWGARVAVEEATLSQMEKLRRSVSPEKLKQLLAKEGVGDFEKLSFVSVTYDEQEPDSYASGTYVGIVVRRR